MEEEIEILRLTSSRADVDYDEQYWRFRNLACCRVLFSSLFLSGSPRSMGTLAESSTIRAPISRSRRGPGCEEACFLMAATSSTIA